MSGKGIGAWVVLAVFGVLVLVALAQGLIIQEVGIPGVASVRFGERAAGDDADGRSAATEGDDAGAVSRPAVTTRAAPRTATADAAVEGSWVGRRGEIAVEVTRVEDQGGHLRVDATVTNGTNEALDLPLFGNVSASDEDGRQYEASTTDSDWPMTIGGGRTVRGTIEFEERYERTGGGTLELTFAVLFGADAPSGSLVVSGIDRP